MKEEKKTTKLADKVNVDTIEYTRSVRTRTERAVVHFAPSSKVLSFNTKMVKLLGMKDWQQVVVGYDRTSELIILKNCDPEEFGSVVVRSGKVAKKNEKYVERAKKCRVISIAHLVKTLNLNTSRRYRAERDGTMIFLEQLDEED